MLDLLVAAVLATAAQADTAPRPDADFPRFFHVAEVHEPGGGYHLVMDSMVESDARAPLFNQHQDYFYYLVLQAPSSDLFALVRSRRWTGPQLDAAFRSALGQDTAFTATLRATVSRFMAPERRSEHAQALPVISMDDVMQVATRFFYPDAILPNGHIQTHICSALNGVHDLQRPRNLAHEAFLFEAINAATTGDTPVSTEVHRLLREMNRADLSADSAIRVTRAQGFLWSRLTVNGVLRRAILDAYEQRKSFLPFAIAPES